MRRSFTEPRWIRAGNAKVSCEYVFYSQVEGGWGGVTRTEVGDRLLIDQVSNCLVEFPLQ